MMHATVLSAVLTMASLFACGLSAQLAHFFVLWSVVLYLAAQCRVSTHIAPPPPHPSLHLPLPTCPSPFHLWALGCPHPCALCSFWMHGFHVVPPSAPLNPRTSSNSVNLRQAAASTLLELTAWSFSSVSGSGMICRFAFTAEDVDVEMCKYSQEPLLLVVRLDDAWHITRVGN